MGMGNYANYADTVTNDFVTKICPDEMAGLLKVLEENDYDIDRLASCATYGGDIYGEMELDVEEEQAKAILDSYVELLKAFSDKVDLGLAIRYKDKEDRGDEVDGMFWEVEGVYVYSSAGEKYKNEIERKFWTNFG